MFVERVWLFALWPIAGGMTRRGVRDLFKTLIKTAAGIATQMVFATANEWSMRGRR
jgi:hypothetical protein